MSKIYDRVIVSCGGRGQWMAGRFAELNFNVALVDVTSHLGRWAPEDWEGPFGYFHSSSFSPSQVERLSEDEYLDNVEEGFSLWLKEGPLDFQGPLSGFRLRELQKNEELSGYLSSYLVQEKSLNKKIQQKISTLDFDDNWVFNLAHQLSSTVYKENVKATQFGRPLPLSSNYSVRRSSRMGHEKSLKWCEQKGVDVFRNAKLRDICLEDQKCTAIEVESDWSGVIEGRQFFWMLSAEETQFCSHTVFEPLFPNGQLSSLWSWVRFGLEVDSEENDFYLPQKFTMIEDLHLPWTLLNLCLVQKTEQNSQLDVWVKVSTQQRFSKKYMEELFEKMKEKFQEKMPGVGISLWHMPQDYLYSYEELGPSRFVQYESEKNKEWSPAKIDNMVFLGPEKLSSWDWTGQMHDHRTVLNKFKNKEESFD